MKQVAKKGNKESKHPLLIKNKNEVPTTSTFLCVPTNQKKPETEEGKSFRTVIFLFMILHVIFSFGSFFLIFGMMLTFRQVIYIYLCFYIYMTLSSIMTVIYSLLVLFGAAYGMVDMFSNSYEGAQAFFIYMALNLLNGYQAIHAFQKMREYSDSKQQKNKKQISQQGNEDDESDDDDESSDEEDPKAKALKLKIELQQKLIEESIAKHMKEQLKQLKKGDQK
ncbi:UNKNOWN [Stylonychia lemnae]|uniref:Transmembrane protein n=1 Tax=Stylonychia lemnae TaxID=5949 RepID=A0A078B5D9_STYLE|nr:UNKNOWN [Stylonychia lemnae]|eukprot:CDW88507.1 UNKNOWN [Stylonychia lemnae]